MVLRKRFLTVAERLKDLVGKYQFWLEDSEYKDVRRANNLLMKRMDAFPNDEDIQQVSQEIEKLLPTVDKYLKSRCGAGGEASQKTSALPLQILRLSQPPK